MRGPALLGIIFFATVSAGAQGPTIYRARLLFEKRSFVDAKALLTSVDKKSSDYDDAQYYLGRIAVEEKHYDRSISYFENAISANKKSAEYHNWLGVMYGVIAMDANPLRQAYLAPKIKKEFEVAASIEPLNIPTQWGLINYYVKAPRIMGGSKDKALACAKVISRQDVAQGYRAYGFVHAATGDKVRGEQEMIQAMKVGPNDPENDYALAAFYVDEKKYEKAMALYESLLKKDPGNMVAAFRLGHATAQCGLYFQRGIICLTDYMGYVPRPNEPSRSDAAVDLATIYEKMGDKVKARSYYNTALSFEPAMKEAIKGLDRLE